MTIWRIILDLDSQCFHSSFTIYAPQTVWYVIKSLLILDLHTPIFFFFAWLPSRRFLLLLLSSSSSPSLWLMSFKYPSIAPSHISTFSVFVPLPPSVSLPSFPPSLPPLLNALLFAHSQKNVLPHSCLQASSFPCSCCGESWSKSDGRTRLCSTGRWHSHANWVSQMSSCQVRRQRAVGGNGDKGAWGQRRRRGGGGWVRGRAEARWLGGTEGWEGQGSGHGGRRWRSGGMPQEGWKKRRRRRMRGRGNILGRDVRGRREDGDVRQADSPLRNDVISGRTQKATGSWNIKMLWKFFLKKNHRNQSHIFIHCHITHSLITSSPGSNTWRIWNWASECSRGVIFFSHF